MLKQHRRQILCTSLLTLLPVLAGLLLWRRLPAQIATHFGADGLADGWSGRAFAVFMPGLFCFGLHLLCAFCTAADPKRRNISDKTYTLILWICPFISLLCGAVIYANALGRPLNARLVFTPMVALLFLAIGNYLPKCRQNYTVGIKVPWALHDAENWNHTHRFAGRLYTAGGVLMLLCTFVDVFWLFSALVAVVALLPVLYSFFYYRKHGCREP